MKKQHAGVLQPNVPRTGNVELPATELRSPVIAADNIGSQEEVSSISDGSESPSIEDIQLQAYYKWELAGRPDGNDLFFWVEAEREANRANKI